MDKDRCERILNRRFRLEAGHNCALRKDWLKDSEFRHRA